MYFRNLDGFRFIASLFVIIGHCDHLLQNLYGIKAYSPYADKLAGFGVDFFYVLSGFLINFLLFEELRKTGTIKVKNFYIRRALRLWPLYFIVGTVGLLTAEPVLRWFGDINRAPTATEWWQNFAYLFTFGINFQILLGKMNPFSSPILGHFWSLSVEEQFYLICAPFLLLCKKYVWIFIATLLMVGWATTVYPFPIFDTWFETNAKHVPFYFTTGRFFHFGLGAALGYLMSNRTIIAQISTLLTTKIQQIVAYFLPKNIVLQTPKYISWAIQLVLFYDFCAYLFGNHYYPNAQERIRHGILSIGLVAAGIAQYSIFFLEINWIKYLGKISFGIYIYHIFAIRLTFKVLETMNISHVSNMYYCLLPFIATVISVSMAALSYEFLEKRILALRKKY
jgi:peptidoglycan/LPS O-acetylase OafA/YrhL